ncbi:superfamily II helicase [Indivirus ILV1]|uniref:Superfamily II helicase n=1 Tax=Indivirus ILV1 TaxID=1977633 RepID=A0A1V0SDY6_9VIRU|nr:superfamily II helicase [Indivirus ILV1]
MKNEKKSSENVLPAHSTIPIEKNFPKKPQSISSNKYNYISHNQLKIHYGLPKLQYHNLFIENYFKKNTHFKSFDSEEDYDKYILVLVHKDKNNLYLFSQENYNSPSRKFFPMDHQSIYFFSKQKKFHLFEHFKKNQRIKLYLDIDLKEHHVPKDLNDEELKTFFDNLVNDCIHVVTEELTKYGVFNPQIVIESSNRKDKLSAHVKFVDVVFEDVYHIKYFMSCINSDLITNKILDPSVYKKGSFRMLWNSKSKNGINLEFYKSINYEYSDDKQLFMDCLLLNIPEKHQFVNIQLPTSTKIINKKLPKLKKILSDDKELNNNDHYELVFQPVNLLKKYVDLLSDKRLKHYSTWYDVGRFLHNCNPTKKCFDLWNEWSKKNMENYHSLAFNVDKWNRFKFGYCSIGSLKKIAKEDNPDKFVQLEYSIEKQAFDSIKFTNNYLLDDVSEKIKDKKSFMAKKVAEWLSNDDIKTLCIKSTYDTGKTRLIYNIIDEYKVKRVLFVSYRQTLTHELHGSFLKLGVKSYLDKAFNADKLICQIESLEKLIPQLDEIYGEDGLELPEYDLVVLDEIESILAHFRSSTIKYKEDTFNLLLHLIENSKKVLALDGDFGNRSFEFINSLSKSIILENQIQKNKRHFIMTNNRNLFDKSIKDDLEKGLNISIVSMSSKLAKYYHSLYQSQYKCVLHCSTSDDEDKEKLKNVNNFWSQYQLVIYSPSIESGCNFDRKHFHKIYIILSNKSTSPRGLLQMCSRIRKLENSNILVYLNNLPYRTKSCFYNYDEVKEYITETCNKYLKPQYTKNDDGKIIIKYKFDLYAKILIHNETENANKVKNLFVPYFIKLLEDKGHTHEYYQIKRSKDALNKDNVMKEEIKKVEDIDSVTFDGLLSLQRNNNASKEDKILIERYMFKIEWKQKELSDEFIDRYYGKTDILKNLRLLYGDNKLQPYIINNRFDNILEFDQVHKMEQVEMIKEIIKTLGYANVGEKIERTAFDTNKNKVITESKFFIDSIKSQMLFGYDKLTINKVVNGTKTIKQFLGFINSVFNDWGLNIRACSKSSHIKVDGKRKTIKIISYELNYIDDIDKYI